MTMTYGPPKRLTGARWFCSWALCWLLADRLIIRNHAAECSHCGRSWLE